MELRAKEHGCNFTTLVYLEHLHQLMQKICPFCNKKKKKKSLFFLFCTPIFTKLPHQFLYYTHLFNKIFIFFPAIISLTNPTQPTQPPSFNHPTTIIKPHNNLATIPFNQATINEIHIPIQPSHHQPAFKNPNPKIHHQPTQSPSSSSTTKIQRSNHHHQPTQIQRSKNPFIKIPKPTRNKEKPSVVKVRESEGRR